MTAASRSDISAHLACNVWEFSDAVLKLRLAEAMAAGMQRYPVFRSARHAARANLERLFDQFALELGCRAHRIASAALLLDGDGVFVRAQGSRKADYCSCFFSLWAESVERAETVLHQIEQVIGARRIGEPMFSIDWNFMTSKRELDSASIEEMADDVLLDAAYPELPQGVHRFISDYLDAEETVLVVQGPPGTGKTRLIRGILGAISQREGRQAQALYTGDKQTLESDEIFVKFITGWDDVFVVEDADHLLRPRSEGNEHLHRFLTIADGVVRSQGRKIIFSTNLPNIGDIDDALIRPGRCFARLSCRLLTRDEAEAALLALVGEDAQRRRAALAALQPGSARGYSLAEVYRAVRSATD